VRREPVRRAATIAAAGALAAAWICALAAAAERADCRFVRGFADFRRAAGADVVGACLADEAADPGTGDVRQPTTRGELVWRRADNTITFSDGQATWVLGPEGLRERPDGERPAREPGD
jgi:hypothetical protein